MKRVIFLSVIQCTEPRTDFDDKKVSFEVYDQDFLRQLYLDLVLIKNEPHANNKRNTILKIKYRLSHISLKNMFLKFENSPFLFLYKNNLLNILTIRK